MKARVYIRAGRAKRWHGGRAGRDKIAASHLRDDNPLRIGDEVLRTLHFAIDVEIPDALFVDPAMPVVKVQVQGDGTYMTVPEAIQVDVPVPTVPDDESEKS
jgi:hypothetical protein